MLTADQKYVNETITDQDAAGIYVTIQRNPYVKIVTAVTVIVHMEYMK